MSLDVYLSKIQKTEIYEANITHNLKEMADRAGIYLAIWRPEELNIKKAKYLIPYIENGLLKLKSDPEYYKQFNPKNGWGNYDIFVSFLEKYLKACIENEEAEIDVSR